MYFFNKTDFEINLCSIIVTLIQHIDNVTIFPIIIVFTRII